MELCDREFESTLQNPRGANLRISPCGEIKCGSGLAKGCIRVPGVQPTITGTVTNGYGHCYLWLRALLPMVTGTVANGYGTVTYGYGHC